MFFERLFFVVSRMNEDESFAKFLLDFFFSTESYHFFDLLSFLTYCLVAFVLGLLFSKAKRNKTLLVLWWALSLVLAGFVIRDICYVEADYRMSGDGVLSLTFLFGILLLLPCACCNYLGRKFYPRKPICWILLILALCAEVMFFVGNRLKNTVDDFGKIKDESLPKELVQNELDVVYDLKIYKADAWGCDSYRVALRKKRDEWFRCAQFDARSEFSEVDSCFWESLNSKEGAEKLVTFVNDYSYEFTEGLVFDGYIFRVELTDYKKRTRRTLDISNAEFLDVPKAFAIETLARTFIPSRESLTKMSPEEAREKCEEKLYQETSDD